ncbi:hypothetical protein Tco_0454496 [Tanacetum coccineum]
MPGSFFRSDLVCGVTDWYQSLSIPSEDAFTRNWAELLLSQAPRSPEYVPGGPSYQCTFRCTEHPEDLVPAGIAALPSTYHSLLPSGTPPLLPIPLPSTSRRADISEADTPPRKRLLLTTPRPGYEIGESSVTAAARQPGPTIETRLLDTERRISEFCTRHHDAQKDRAAVRAEIENGARCHEWQHQAADDLAVQYIMHTQALEAGARIDTLEDTGSSS